MIWAQDRCIIRPECQYHPLLPLFQVTLFLTEVNLWLVLFCAFVSTEVLCMSCVTACLTNHWMYCINYLPAGSCIHNYIFYWRKRTTIKKSGISLMVPSSHLLKPKILFPGESSPSFLRQLQLTCLCNDNLPQPHSAIISHKERLWARWVT